LVEAYAARRNPGDNETREREDAMPNTGEVCTQSGVYNGVCTKNRTHQVKQVAVNNGDPFPLCYTGACKGSVEYMLVQATKGVDQPRL
jgi:hypothetical protein